MKKVLVTISCFISLSVLSQSYKWVQNEVTAKYKVFITSKQSEATILGYKVNSYTEVLKPGLIYFAPAYFNKATPVYKVNNASEADIIIYWVDSKEKAKWL